MPEAPWGRCTRWLTCITVDPAQFGATREDVRLALEWEDSESWPLWKPAPLTPRHRGELSPPRIGGLGGLQNWGADGLSVSPPARP